MNHGPEHQPNFHITVKFGSGEQAVVRARHSTTRRMPRGNELMKQMARGQPHQMVEEKHYLWMVEFRHRVVGTLRQHPNGAFHDGHRTYSEDIARAARGLVTSIVPGVDAEPKAPASSAPGR